MKKSLFLKTFTALILSSFLVLSAGTANAKRLTAAVADWTGGEITCQVAVSMLEQELGYRVDRIEFASGTGLWEAIAAGIGICLLAMIIDRISLAWTKKQRDALGL